MAYCKVGYCLFLLRFMFFYENDPKARMARTVPYADCTLVGTFYTSR